MRNYEFVVRGRLDRDAIPGLSGFTRIDAGDDVVLTGQLDSEQELAAVLDQFAALGLGLHGFRALRGLDCPTSPDPS